MIKIGSIATVVIGGKGKYLMPPPRPWPTIRLRVAAPRENTPCRHTVPLGRTHA